MPDYKKRWIELRTAGQHADGTWSCPYVIFEFGTTQWGYKKGCPDGSFASREEAEMAALGQAKQVIDSLKPAAKF